MNRPFLLVAIIVALATGLFIVDLLVPLGLAVWIPYVGVVLLSLWLPRPWHVYATAAACTLLIILGLFISKQPGAVFWMATLNRLLGMFALSIAAFVGLAVCGTLELQEANRRLQQEIVEREKLQAQFLRTQRLESIGFLASGIAHDFNNLLTPILMATKLLKEERPEEERQRLLETLQASAERGADIVRQLLAFTGGGELERAVVRLEHLVRELKSILDHTLPKSIEIAISLQAESWPVHADATQLAQVLLNLCVNARDAMPNGGTLTISANNLEVGHELQISHPDVPMGAYVVLSVADTGCGIPADVLDNVFDPFFTTKEPGKGTGLGLSTAIGIVRAHGGFIDVSSEVGKGSRFDVYLPAQLTSAGSIPPKRPKEIVYARGETILVVDDELLILETAKTTLEEHGFRVLAASGGEEAVALFKLHGSVIEAVILDMMMPGMDGMRTSAALRALAPSVRIITSSGLRPRSHVEDGTMESGLAFLQKPYSDKQLLQILGTILRRT